MYENRQDAGDRLANAISYLKGQDAIVMALPRGGAVIGKAISKKLELPLGLIMVKKIAHPYSSEYAIGAIAEEDEPIFQQSETKSIKKPWLNKAIASSKIQTRQQRQSYYGQNHIPYSLKNKVVVIVDDGMATGLTMCAAIKFVRSKLPQKIIVAVPVASRDSLDKVRMLANATIILEDPSGFLGSVGAHYLNFDQVKDEEVRTILKEARNELLG